MNYRCGVVPFMGCLLVVVAGGVFAADLQRPTLRAPGVAPSAPAGVHPGVSAKPDLAITSLAWSTPPQAGQRIGYTSILNVQIRNLGTAPAPAVQISYQCRRISPAGACPAPLSGMRNVPALGGGASVGVAWPDASATLWSAGSYAIEVRLDPRNIVAEGSESNNSRSINFSVAGSTMAPMGAPPAAGGMVSPLQKRAINPQPEPPGKAQHGIVSPAEKIGINPQPEPPGKVQQGITSPAGKIGINPQPEPPRQIKRSISSPAEKKGINPQPEPPGGAVPLKPQSRQVPGSSQAPVVAKVVTAQALTVTGHVPAPFVPKSVTAEPLTVTGHVAAPFVPKVAMAEQLTVTGHIAAPFVPKAVTTAPMTITGHRP